MIRSARKSLGLALLAAVMLSSVSARATEKHAVWKVPIFYVTDRESDGAAYGPDRLPEKDTVSAMHAGVAEVSISEPAKSQQADWQKDGTPPVTSKSAAPLKLAPFKCETVKDLKGEFDPALLDAIHACPRNEVFIFVHGFNTPFAVAAQNAATLSFFTGCPVILYSWPSIGKLYRYSADECNNEWSQEHFNEFLEHLDQLKKSEQVKLNLVAHSMGNRLFVRAIPVLQGRGLFSDVYMVNPDFDAQTFIHYLSRYIPKEGFREGVRGELLVSRRDKALSAAQGLFCGYTRLGQGADFTLSALTRPELFGNVWSEGADSAEKAAVEMQRAASLSKVVRIVDVTALDHGAIGHKIPHEYIAWMHHRSSAPPGYELQEDTSNKVGNRLSRAFAHLSGQHLEAPEGKSLIVIKSPPAPPVSKEDENSAVNPR